MVSRRNLVIMGAVAAAGLTLSAAACETIFGGEDGGRQSAGACESTGLDWEDPKPLRVPAPPLAFFPGMEDTVIAHLGYERLEPTATAWESSDPDVVSVDSLGVVRAEGLGSAWIRICTGAQVDSIHIDVVKAPGGRIAFGGQKVRNGERGLWTVNPDGTGLEQHLERESAAGGSFSNPEYSPDGCRMVYQYTPANTISPRLKVLDLRTGDTYTIIGEASGPGTWSPDGQTIAFSARTSTGFEIFTSPSDGGERFTDDFTQRSHFGDQPVAPAIDFMPRSDDIVMALGVKGDEHLESDLYRFNLSAGVATPLFVRDGMDELRPSVSPDGQAITFGGPGRTTLPDGTAVHIVQLDSHEVRTLTPPMRIFRGIPGGTPTAATSPSFSPNGSWIAFVWNRDLRLIMTDSGRRENTIGEIYVIRRDGSYPVRVTHTFWSHSPAWGLSCGADQEEQ